MHTRDSARYTAHVRSFSSAQQSSQPAADAAAHLLLPSDCAVCVCVSLCVAGMLSMMVLVVAIVCMVVVTQCLNRPLTLVVRYMSAVSQMGKHKAGSFGGGVGQQLGPVRAAAALSRSAEQLRQLKEIYASGRTR